MVLKKYHIRGEYHGNLEYHPVNSNSCIIRVDDPHYVLTLKTDKTVYDTDDTIKITCTLKDQFGKNMNGDVELTIINPNGLITNQTVRCVDGIYIYSGVFKIIGMWTIKGVAKGNNNYQQSTSNDLNLTVGKAPTLLQLKTNSPTAVVNNNIKLTATLTDEMGNLLHGKLVQFYKNKETEPFTTATTIRGVATINTKIDTVSVSKFWCVFSSDALYTTSKSQVESINIIPQPAKLTLLNTILFPTWKVEVSVVDYQGNDINNQKVHVKLWSKTDKNIWEGDVVTGDGVATTKKINFSTDDPIFYEIKYYGDSNHSSTVLKDDVNGIPVKLYQGVKINPRGLRNINTNDPYRGWSDLAKALVYGEGEYSRSGISCDRSPIQRRSLGFNTPAPLRLSDMDINIPRGSTITFIDVRCNIRVLGCDNKIPRFHAPKAKIQVNNTQTLTTIGGYDDKNSETEKQFINPSSFKLLHHIFNNPNITSNILNSDDFHVDLVFSANLDEFKGVVELDYVDMLIYYIPTQVL